MSSPQMRDPITPCKFPTILHLSPSSHKSKSDLYPFNKSQSPRYWQHQASTATPTPKDESLRAPRYHGLSCDRLTQNYRVQSEHLVPQSDVSKRGSTVSGDQQNSCLQGGVNSASGPKRCRGLYKSHLRKAHWYAGSSKECGNLGAVKTQPDDRHPPGAPPMRPIPLPKRQEGDENISYYGLGLAPGSLLAGTVQADNAPKILSCLDMALPVPFP